MPVAALAVLFSLRSIVEIGGDGAWGQVGHEVDLVSQSSIASEASEDFTSSEAVGDDLDGASAIKFAFVKDLDIDEINERANILLTDRSSVIVEVVSKALLGI